MSPDTSGPVLPGEDGTMLNNVKKSWADVLTAAGIEAFRWHDLRHHFASKLAMAGIDLNTIRDLLGHSSYAMTLWCAHLASNHKRKAVDVLCADRSAGAGDPRRSTSLGKSQALGHLRNGRRASCVRVALHNLSR